MATIIGRIRKEEKKKDNKTKTDKE
jgi:hypothetical protein